MTFHGDPKHIDRLRQPRLDSNRCLDRIVGSFQAAHSGMLRVSSRTNEERNVIALVGKCCSDEPAYPPGSENSVLHDTPSKGEPPAECSTSPRSLIPLHPLLSPSFTLT